jgi:uncharacterized membrane protein YjjP (DUF1212 family)/uncharacterized membrane protein YjjB (DUF3815 family)
MNCAGEVASGAALTEEATVITIEDQLLEQAVLTPDQSDTSQAGNESAGTQSEIITNNVAGQAPTPVDATPQTPVDILPKLVPQHVTIPQPIETAVNPIILPSYRHLINRQKLLQRFQKSKQDFQHVLENVHVQITHNDEQNDIDKPKTLVTRFKEWRLRKPIAATSKKLYLEMTEQEQLDVRLFIVDFAYAMSAVGTPSHRLECNLQVVSTHFGLTASYFCTPTGIWFNFGDLLIHDNESTPIQPNYNYFVRMSGASSDLGKFIELDDLAAKIESGQFQDIHAARAKITNILNSKSHFSHPLYTILTIVGYSSLFPVLLNGTWGEIIAAIIGGMVVATIMILQSKFPALGRIGSALCTFLCGIVAILFRFALFKTGVHIDILLVAFSGVVLLLPGLSLTVSVDELTAGHLMSGTMRIVGVLVGVINLIFGLIIASRVDSAISSASWASSYYVPAADATFSRQVLPDWMKLLALPPMIAILIICFKVPRSLISYFFITVACTGAYVGSMYWPLIVSSEISSMLNAFFVGFIGNIYAVVTKKPSNVVNRCAICLLVPGYMTSMSAAKLALLSDAPTAVVMLFNAIMTAMSLVIGLVFAEMVFPKGKGRKLSFH